MFDTPLSPEEQRVLGCLVEKQMSTPDYYPLTLNALVNACNQSSNRDPVQALGEETVLEALDLLRDRQLLWVVDSPGSRAREVRASRGRDPGPFGAGSGHPRRAAAPGSPDPRRVARPLHPDVRFRRSPGGRGGPGRDAGGGTAAGGGPAQAAGHQGDALRTHPGQPAGSRGADPRAGALPDLPAGGRGWRPCARNWASSGRPSRPSSASSSRRLRHQDAGPVGQPGLEVAGAPGRPPRGDSSDPRRSAPCPRARRRRVPANIAARSSRLAMCVKSVGRVK